MEGPLPLQRSAAAPTRATLAVQFQGCQTDGICYPPMTREFVLDLPALQRWLATRPPGGETRIPVLAEGVRIRDGRIDNDDWRIEGLSIDLPSLHPERLLRAHVRGRYVDPPLSVPADTAGLRWG